MTQRLVRTEMLLGKEALETLKDSRVCIFGVGGVGSYVVEALARAGVGHMTLVDNDDVAESNINRQIIATTKTVGRSKVEVAAERVRDINPDSSVICVKSFYLPENSSEFVFTDYDYVVDAIDTVSAKIDIALKCSELGVPVISSMGTGNKLDPTKFEVTDIYKTSGDPLARVMRRELKKRNVKKLKVVYSTEEAKKPVNEEDALKESEESGSKRRSIPGSVSFVPSVAGLIIAGEVIKDLIRK